MHPAALPRGSSLATTTSATSLLPGSVAVILVAPVVEKMAADDPPGDTLTGAADPTVSSAGSAVSSWKVTTLH